MLVELKEQGPLGRKLDVGLAIVDKRRPSPGKSQVMNVMEMLKKNMHYCDDIIDSGGTIVNAAEALIKRGAKEFMCMLLMGF